MTIGAFSGDVASVALGRIPDLSFHRLSTVDTHQLDFSRALFQGGLDRLLRKAHHARTLDDRAAVFAQQRYHDVIVHLHSGLPQDTQAILVDSFDVGCGQYRHGSPLQRWQSRRIERLSI
jgi:hypothetical protein